MLFYRGFKKWDLSFSLWCEGNERLHQVRWITELFYQLTCCRHPTYLGAFVKLQIKQQWLALKQLACIYALSRQACMVAIFQ